MNYLYTAIGIWLGSLIEVGNGVTDDDLHAQVDEMLRFRDEWLNHKIKK